MAATIGAGPTTYRTPEIANITANRPVVTAAPTCTAPVLLPAKVCVVSMVPPYAIDRAAPADVTSRERQLSGLHGRTRTFAGSGETSMNAFARQSIWFNRVVLGGATILFSLIGVRYIADPVGEVAPHAITLGSAEAITMMRVSGAVFVGIAAILFASLFSERRIRDGIAILAVISIAVTAVRIFRLVGDGAGPFPLKG